MKINWGTGTDMNCHAYRTMAAMLMLCAGASSGWAQQYFLYSPNAVDKGHKLEKKDGVLVQEMHVQRGDTLYDISRKFSGHGTYYPQILLFNKLNNPDRIYPGNVIRVPVNQLAKADTGDHARGAKQTVASSAVETVSPPSRKGPRVKHDSGGAAPLELSTKDLRKSDSGRLKKQTRKKTASKKTAQREKRSVAPVPVVRAVPVRIVQTQTPPAKVSASSSQKVFEQAVKAYRQENYRSALELFDRFLAENPSSPLAPDASFYKAECYLKQSSQ